MTALSFVWVHPYSQISRCDIGAQYGTHTLSSHKLRADNILFYTLSSSAVKFNIFSSNWFLFFKKSVGDKFQPLIVANSYKLMGQ